MSTALQTVKKLQLWSLIKVVGTTLGEDEETLKEYGKEVYNVCNIDQAIQCFENLVKQIKDGVLKNQ